MKLQRYAKIKSLLYYPCNVSKIINKNKNKGKPTLENNRLSFEI